MSRWLRTVFVFTSGCVTAALVPMIGCSSDENPTGAPSVAATTPLPTSNPTTTTNHPAPTAVPFTVPSSGGSVDVGAPSGEKLTFVFPASAAGKDVVLTPADATSIGWTAGDFRDVIKMEPDGTQFVDPVIVRSSAGGVMLATFPSGTTKTTPEWLAIAPDGSGAELHHFSTLVVVDGGCSFSKQAASQLCKGGGTLLSLACDLPQLCSHASVTCCVDAASGANDCQFGAAALHFAASPLLAGNSPAYCPSNDASAPPDASSSDSGDAGGGDGSGDAGGGDGSTADSSTGGGDSGVNGNCSTGTFIAGDAGTNTCRVNRIDGTATLSMICTASACQCYTNATPYGAPFSSGTADCANQALALQQMIAYCGCP